MNLSPTNTPVIKESDTKRALFHKDVLSGLQTTPKRLNSKYFYDARGDRLFQELMNCPEYYLTKAELEIFSTKTAGIAQLLMSKGDEFDLIELGAGDAMKSMHLLKYLSGQKAAFTYFPIDISGNVISYLNTNLPLRLPGLKLKGMQGEYFDCLKKAASLSEKRKVVLFLGSNIGNMPPNEILKFCSTLRQNLSKGDVVLMGIDLIKAPKTILAAYNDQGGITKNFNLNLLTRINRELDADFDIKNFDHYAMYDPETGSCKSYLISLSDQSVTIGDRENIRFQKNEYIYMEISQKFTVPQTDQLALNTGFKPVAHFFDSKKWFLDTIWEVE